MGESAGLLIFDVEKGSLAARAGVEPGDVLLKVNGEPVRDLIDLVFLEADDFLTLHLKKKHGGELVIELEKEYDESLGIDLGPCAFGKIRRCNNRCLFCFVDQMPAGLRESLHLKDDDYRLSFWHGNFITLTNMTPKDFERIARQRLSPLYISVHTTDPQLRRTMLGNERAGLIADQLRWLAGAGIEMHTQVVLCPGLNDGGVLEKTIDDLAGLWPHVRSLAVVPVGLTRFRSGLFPLSPVGPEEALKTVDLVERKQRHFLHLYGYPFVFASDEMYILGGRDIPPAHAYGGFPQLENGVGMVRTFLDEFRKAVGIYARRRAKAQTAPAAGRSVLLITGQLFFPFLSRAAAVLSQKTGIKAEVLPVKNDFFGESVTVAGLLTGRDILSQLKARAGDYRAVVLPDAVFKKGDDVFLDGMTKDELVRRANAEVTVVGGPKQLVEVLSGGGAPCPSR